MNYRLFKPRYTDRKTGKPRPSSRWHVDFRSHLGVRLRWPAFKEENKSHAQARRFVQLAECRRERTALPADLMKWLDTIDDDLRDRIVKADMLDAVALARHAPLRDYLNGKIDDYGNVLEPGYRQHLLAEGDTPEYVELTAGRILKMLDGCALGYWKDLTDPGAVASVQQYLAGLRTAKEISGKTFGYYARAMRSFCTWLAKRFQTTSPMQHLSGVRDAAVDEQERRHLLPAELEWIIRTVIAGKVTRFDLDPEERVRLYRFCYETGIRPGQVRQLRVSSFDLEADPPTVTSKAGTVKVKRKHTQALRSTTAAELRTLFESKVPDALAFRMPDKFHCAEMLRADMADARDAWIDAAGTDVAERVKRLKSDFLAAVDHEGRRADFYSIRHTHGTALAEAGIAQKDISASLGHSRTATTDRYLNTHREQKARAVEALPEIMVMRATGTDGKPDALGQSLAECVPASAQDGNEKPLSRPGRGVYQRGRRGSNPQPPDLQSGADSQISGDSPESPVRLAKAWPTSDPDLEAVIAAWPNLPADVRRTIVGVVRLSPGGAR